MVTRSQRLMIDDGLPTSIIISDEERKAAWAASPPRPQRIYKENRMKAEHPNFAAMDLSSLKDAYSALTIEAHDQGLPFDDLPADVTATQLIAFCEDLYHLILEAKAELKSKKYDNADISSEQKPVKKKKAAIPKTIREVFQEAAPKTKKAAKKAAKTAAKPAAKPAATKKPTGQTSIAAALGLRPGTLHEKIAVFLEARIGKMVKEQDIVKHLYGDPDIKTNRIKDLMKVMKKDKYDLKKEENNGVTSYGLYAKK